MIPHLSAALRNNSPACTIGDSGYKGKVIIMKTIRNGLLVSVLFIPTMLAAQNQALDDLTAGGGQAYCRSIQVSSQLRYGACLQEQRQALARIRSLNSRYSSQQFFQQIAVPHCGSAVGTDRAINLVELSFCLGDEVQGYQVIQSLRQRYGSSRVESEIEGAISATGSWAEAASRVKRNTGLKTIRRGSSS